MEPQMDTNGHDKEMEHTFYLKLVYIRVYS